VVFHLVAVDLVVVFHLVAVDLVVVFHLVAVDLVVVDLVVVDLMVLVVDLVVVDLMVLVLTLMGNHLHQAPHLQEIKTSQVAAALRRRAPLKTQTSVGLGLAFLIYSTMVRNPLRNPAPAQQCPICDQSSQHGRLLHQLRVVSETKKVHQT
jgi:hypothetical protein